MYVCFPYCTVLPRTPTTIDMTEQIPVIMKRGILIIACIIAITSAIEAQSPSIVWAQTFGGFNNDEAYDIIKTTDGGYAICGMTESKGAGGKDAWIIKIDPQGKLEWEKTYGDKGDEVANAIIQTSDNGYAFVGYTTSKGKGKRDVFFVKVDSAGNREWEGVYGGPKQDYGTDLVQTKDGNYVFIGSTKSFGSGNYDIWLSKIDNKGKRMWKKTEGGKGADYGNSVVEHPKDSSLIICGTTFNNANGLSDLWLIKLTKDGRKDWRKNYGNVNKDGANHLTLKSTGEYIVSGTTQPSGERYDDFWVVGFTAESWDDWEYTKATTTDEAAMCSSESADGGVIVCGYTNEIGEGSYDFYLMKFDARGKQLWYETYGGINEDKATAIVATGKNEAVVCGYTMSDGEGKRDIWVIYLK
jgi:predicted secreted protein